jgi:hypothetical protein
MPVDYTCEAVLRMGVTASVIGQHASKTALVELDIETDLSQEGAMDDSAVSEGAHSEAVTGKGGELPMRCGLSVGVSTVAES